MIATCRDEAAADASVASLRRVIDGLTIRDKGLFLNHRGEEPPW